MTFQSYIHGQDDPQPTPDAIAAPASPYRNRDTVSFVTSNDGAVTETTQTHDKGNTSELNPHHGTDSVLATARHPQGLPVYQIEATTLIEVNGIPATAAFWAKEGILTKQADGTFTEATSKPAEVQQADTSEHHGIDPHRMAIVNSALADVDQGALDGLAATAMGVAVGRLDASALSIKFSQVSGHDGEQGSGRLDSIKAVYQAQADDAITSRMGINRGDLPAFYKFAKENMQGQLTDAVMMQIHQHNLGGYRAIAAQWLAKTAPSAAALKAAGYPVRVQDGVQEAFIQGQWLQPASAAKMNMI